MTEINCLLDAKARLGEGPCWHAATQRLWWVDIFAREIHSIDPASGNHEVFATPDPPGCIAVRLDGDLVVAMAVGFYHFNISERTFQLIAETDLDPATSRMNDGRTDPQGRFWAGSTSRDGTPAHSGGGLYRLDAPGSCKRMAPASISNGLAWSPDSRVMYHADSATPSVWAWDFDPETGEIVNQRRFVDLSSIGGVADGAAVDAEGGYWVALPFKSEIRRYEPNGQLSLSISLPVDVPTACEFGGENLDVLFVTSATLDRSASELSDQPLAGALLALDVGIRGTATAAFVGLGA